MTITKRELRNNVVPIVKRFLRDTMQIELQYYDPIFTHASRSMYDATIVFEGCEWAYDFVDDIYNQYYNGDIEIEYAFDVCNAYEISIARIQ